LSRSDLMAALSTESLPDDSEVLPEDGGRPEAASEDRWQPITALLGLPKPPPKPAARRAALPAFGAMMTTPPADDRLQTLRADTAYGAFRRAIDLGERIAIAMVCIATVAVLFAGAFRVAIVLVALAGLAVQIAGVVVLRHVLHVLADFADHALRREPKGR
jgi:hypothetical protein